MKNKFMKKQNYSIALVALVVTIVVLLILAGITICIQWETTVSSKKRKKQPKIKQKKQ